MASKTNPRRKPATQEDVRKAKAEGFNEGMNGALVITLYVLLDKHGYTKEQLQKFNADFHYQVEIVNERRATADDMVDVLRDEYGIEFELV